MRALLSVADRDGIVDLARELTALGVDLVAADDTREVLLAAGLSVASMAHPSEHPERADAPASAGDRASALHPSIQAGIVARRSDAQELAALDRRGVGLIDLVVVNVPPFAPAVGTGSVPIDEAVGMIDVTGIALLRAAARNYAGVTVMAHPVHYAGVIEELRRLGGVSAETRQRLAAEAFAVVAAYDAEVAGYLNHLSGVRFPEQLTVVLQKQRDLPYGENPHQQAAFYRETTHRRRSLADATQLQGADPTFNDLLDLDTAYRIASDFSAPTCCVAKQVNPVGLASSETVVGAYRRALDGDPVAAYGAVIAFNRVVDAEAAQELVLGAYEAVAAPGFSEEALRVLSGRPALPLLAVPSTPPGGLSDYGIADLDFHRIDGGLLVETLDRLEVDHSRLRVVTRRRPTLDELTDLLFGWRAVRHVRSNAVVLAHHGALVGVGAGQASRLTAVEIALHRAAERGHGAVLASDAYFPFADAIQLAGERGVTAIIQPGGSVRDEMAIEVADRHHLAMVFTGRRHFRH